MPLNKFHAIKYLCIKRLFEEYKESRKKQINNFNEESLWLS